MGAKTTVTKEVTFDCAHMLSGHEGLCKNLHGHTYKLQVTISSNEPGKPLKRFGPAEGMVLDFKELNQLIKDRVVGLYDHAFIYWMDGCTLEIALANALMSQDCRVVAMASRPTAENMAWQIFQDLSFALENQLNIKLESVRLWETPTSFAEVLA